MKRIYYTLFLIVLGMAEMNAQRQQSEEGQSRSSRFGRQMDANGDGKISREEFPGPKETFDQFDKDICLSKLLHSIKISYFELD